jgi:hypothetical protein
MFIKHPVDAGSGGRKALLERLDKAVTRLIETFQALADPETIVYEGWTAKDILGHLTFWHESFARNVSDLVEGRKPMPLRGKLVDLNRRSVEESRGVDIEQLIERLSTAQQTIRQSVLSPSLALFPYRKGSRDYTPEEHLEIVNDHIVGHLKAIERALDKAAKAGCSSGARSAKPLL